MDEKDYAEFSQKLSEIICYIGCDKVTDIKLSVSRSDSDEVMSVTIPEDLRDRLMSVMLINTPK